MHFCVFAQPLPQCTSNLFLQGFADYLVVEISGNRITAALCMYLFKKTFYHVSFRYEITENIGF